MAATFAIDAYASSLISTLSEFKSPYYGFEWESERWEKERCRRSPYGALVLFGLSPRTRDSLLVEICRQFFRRFPDRWALARQSGGFLGEVKAIVRQGQAPFVMSLAQVLVEQEAVPKTVEELLEIRGGGQKITDCVVAYSWGQDDLLLDANVYRVLCRIQRGGGRDRAESTSELRGLLKWSYHEYRTAFACLSISMADLHEILRMHGQVCWTRKPDCAACPVSNCSSRLGPMEPNRSRQITPVFWDDWSELLLEPN